MLAHLSKKDDCAKASRSGVDLFYTIFTIMLCAFNFVFSCIHSQAGSKWRLPAPIVSLKITRSRKNSQAITRFQFEHLKGHGKMYILSQTSPSDTMM